jgi:hypothetical protein
MSKAATIRAKLQKAQIGRDFISFGLSSAVPPLLPIASTKQARGLKIVRTRQRASPDEEIRTHTDENLMMSPTKCPKFQPLRPSLISITFS